ncbi:hypothetical protein SAMN05443144_1064 [Fodinibius roseus]|uniref:Uncharacterized protein n=1 Tax=Fodinibius roseus TaxID=1194090 RepID=A0A1M4ZE37_9BACT|nr:hypothetical protein [Fodinibius roseus]SHF16238.1 hypothetical protein SAMN05443144_1064 [Fodinibius roseus]
MLLFNKYGKLVQDKREVPFAIPDDIANPFDGIIKSNGSSKLLKAGRSGSRKITSKKLLGPGYLLIDVGRNNPKGIIYKAIDLREQDSVGI